MRAIATYTLLVVVGVLGAAGDAVLNRWARGEGAKWLALSYGVWVGVATLFGLVLRTERFTFGAAVVVALVVHSTVAVAIDRTYFGGHVTAVQWVGLFLAISSLVLIEVGRAGDA